MTNQNQNQPKASVVDVRCSCGTLVRRQLRVRTRDPDGRTRVHTECHACGRPLTLVVELSRQG